MTVINNQDLIYLANTTLFVSDCNNQYIYISEMPSYLGKGKNSFLIGIKKDSFEPDTLLNVFFLDKKGHSIPVVVTEYTQRMMIRCFIQINQSHPVGFGTFVVIGCLSNYNNEPIPPNQKFKANIKYQKQIYVNPNQKTPSVLRFRNKPEIITYIDQKRLYEQQIVEEKQCITISNITIQDQHNDFICLNVDTNSILHSVYYEKFLNYKLVNDLSKVTSFNEIFSGSIELGQQSNLGNYYGTLTSSNKNAILGRGDITIYNGILQLGSISNSNITSLEGRNLQQIKLGYQSPYEKFTPSGTYSIYLENAIIDNLQIPISSSTTIKQIQYISKINKAINISLETHYFSGSILINGQLYSENFQFNSEGFAIYGSKKNLKIRRPDAFTSSRLQEFKNYQDISITNSQQQMEVLSTGRTIIRNCDIENAFIGHKLTNNISTFDYLEGQLYSTNLITQMQFDQTGNSYLSGSLRGSGTLYTKTDGAKLIINSNKTIIYDSASLIKLENSYIFEGEAYNVNLKVIQFSGSICSSSIMDQQYYTNYYNPDITYSKMLLNSNNIKLEASTISYVQIHTSPGIDTPKFFNLLTSQTTANSYINLKSQTPFTISLHDEKYVLDGYFHLQKGEAQSSSFTGYYQLSNNFYELEQYQMIAPILTPQYQKIFGTKEIQIFNNDYSKLYIPIALQIKRDDISNLSRFITSSIDTSSLEIQISYNYKNKLAKPTLSPNMQILPLSFTIDKIDIYSGYFSGLQISYNTEDNDMYQLFSNIEFGTTYTFPLTRSLDIPFIQRTVNLLFKPKDALGRYSPQEFYHCEYGIKLENKSIAQKIIKNASIENNVISVNQMTGNITLTSYDIPHLQTAEPIPTYNLGQLIDTYYNNWQYDAGVLNTPEVTTGSNGELFLGSGQYLVYSKSNYDSPLYRFSVSSVTDFTPTGDTVSRGLENSTTTYINFNYQRGLYSTTDLSEINMSNTVPVLMVYRSETDLKYLNWFQTPKGLANRVTDRLFRTRMFQVQNGNLILGQSKSDYSFPYITCTSGYVWYGPKKIFLNSFNSSESLAYLWYSENNPITWSHQSVIGYNNQYYNNDGLNVLSPNYFTVNWIYRFLMENGQYTAIMLSSEQYQSMQEAQIEAKIPMLPPILQIQALLIGRVIIQKDATASSIIQSAFNTSFGGVNSGGAGVSFLYVHPSDGIEAIVQDPSSTPDIYLSLGTITPDNVETPGYVSASSFSASCIHSQELITNQMQVQFINNTASSEFGNNIVQYQYQFSLPQTIIIGDTQSKIITWSIDPTYKLPTQQFYTLSYCDYPDQQNWIPYKSGSVQGDIRSLTVLNCSKSTRLQIMTYDRGYPSYGKYGYIYVRNNLKIGCNQNILEFGNFQDILDSLANSWTSNNFIANRIVNPQIKEYIYFACPQYMTEFKEPMFVIDDIGGGFQDVFNYQYRNQYGYIQQYSVYKSCNFGLGNINLGIKEFCQI